MAIKKIVQDIVPNERRSVRKIVIDREEEPTPKITRRRSAVVVEDNEEEEILQPTHHKKPKHAKGNGSYRFLITFIVLFVSIGTIILALSLSYSKAIVTITPKVVNYSVDGTFTAKKNDPNSDLSYSPISVSDSVTQSISATKGPLIQTKAKGSVIIYNNFSPSPQTLVAGTRIATEEGLIYRTASTVSVPGKKTTPGTIAVTVVAEKAGDNYNLNISEYKGNLNFPGFKGTTKFTGFYAKLKTSIAGGFYGNKMTINDQTKKDAISAMQAILKTQLLAKLNQNVPSDFVFFQPAYNIEFETTEPVMKGTDTADLTLKAVAYGAIFNTNSLIRYVAGKEINKFPTDTYIIDGDKKLSFNVSNPKDFSIKKGTSLIFTLKGPITITGTFSENDLKNKLKGIRLQDSNAVFAKYPSIANAYALITPFWLRSFPNDAEKIKIEYKH